MAHALNTPLGFQDAIGFLSGGIPRAKDGVAWEHYSSTAYQVGCEALVALGQASKVDWGAIPLEVQRMPDPLPRWDDICLAVLYLCEQMGSVDYRFADGSSSWGTSPVPQINIVPSANLGGAYATPLALSVLEKLGLVADGRWTDVATTIFWRQQPNEWSLKVESEAIFLAAVDTAVATLPDELRHHVEELVTITNEQVVESYDRFAARIRESRQKNPSGTQTAGTLEAHRGSVEFSRLGRLDWLFYKRWRLDDGWLNPGEARRALGIFHDPLAWQARQAVTTRLYPDIDFLRPREESSEPTTSG